MGPAVRDLSRELHFRFLGLAKYLRSRQKVEFSEFPALSCVLQSRGLVANMRLGQFCAPAFRVRLGAGWTCPCEFQMSHIIFKWKDCYINQIRTGRCGKNTILLFLLLSINACICVFDSVNSAKKWDIAELRWNKKCLALNQKSIKRGVTPSGNISKLQCFAIRACSMVQYKRVGVDHTASLKGISSLKAIMCRMNLCIKKNF